MRRKERELNSIEAKRILENGDFGILSMCTLNNQGYGVPLNYVMIDDAIYFHCANEGEKLDIIKVNCKVSFCVVGKSQVISYQFAMAYESAIAFGCITEVENEKKEVLMHFLIKYSQDHIKEGERYIEANIQRVRILKLSITSITGKKRNK